MVIEDRTYRCGDCGSKKVKRQNAKGRDFGYGRYESVILKVDLDLLTCQECTNILMAPGDAAKLDEAIRQSLKIGDKASAPWYYWPFLGGRFQVVKCDQGYRVRIRYGIFFWKWMTEFGRKGEQIAFFLNQEEAENSAHRYLELKKDVLKVKKGEVVFDSALRRRPWK